MNRVKLSWLFNTISSGTTPPTNRNEYYDSGKINWLNTGDLNDGIVQDIRKKVTYKAIYDFPSLKVYSPNSIVMAMYGATIGKLGIINQEFCTNQACVVLSNPKKNVDSKFIYYCLMNQREDIINLANGGGQPNISQSIVRNIRLELPEKILQELVVKYLDKKIVMLSNLIATKEKQIKLLEEQRQSMITEAVTKGLNSSVRMKDSGVEWIGEIPEHWEIAKIKYTTYVKGRIGWQGLRSDEFIDDGPYLVTGTNFKNGIVDWQDCYHISEDRYNEAVPIQLKEDDLLITKDGTIGKLALVKEMPGKTILNSGIFVTRPLANKYINNYLYWNLNSASFSQYIRTMETGSTIKHLYQETFVNYSYALPSLEEQESISCYLNNKNQKLGNVIQNITIQISKLKEYRHSLIHEAVTGKIAIEEMESYLKEVDKDDN
ncbi:restriction endonuclease subunit S [Listeria seeligeri]|uniref:restriction endonuclease subunit S n=1 Tax=Listeria seeligeri TaxID=1640 RepID=UPI0010B94843|nr:restriction endonuclease subunit S [Listeria seeligeri]